MHLQTIRPASSEISKVNNPHLEDHLIRQEIPHSRLTDNSQQGLRLHQKGDKHPQLVAP